MLVNFISSMSGNFLTGLKTSAFTAKLCFLNFLISNFIYLFTVDSTSLVGLSSSLRYSLLRPI